VTVELRTSPDLLQQQLYHPIAIASGSRQVYLAGQVGVRPDGGAVADDLPGQVLAALGNVVAAVRAAGGTAADIVRLTVFVVGWTEATIEPFETALARAQSSLGLPTPLPPLTVIGVQSLYRPELLVEIEGIAVLD
jgi:enamine deaminase RidA (YjgF/YER057c/UK114 family)